MDFDSLPNDAPQASPGVAQQPQETQAQPPQPQAQPQDQAQPGMSFDDLVDDQDKYSTSLQQAKTFGEGALRGVVGPLQPVIEKAFGAKEQDILGREKENPIIHGIGEGAGLVGGSLTGVGEGALLGKAGEAATAVAGLANIGKDASLGLKVGSAAVQNAAEMAVLSGSDDVAKMILKDPDTSAESAIANASLSAVLGGAGGAFFAGAVNPLWEASGAPEHLESILNAIKTRANGEVIAPLTPTVENAATELGIKIPAELRAGMSGNNTAEDAFNALRRNENHVIQDGIDATHEAASKAVTDAVGIPLEEIHEFSDNDMGHQIHEAFSKELTDKYEPIAAALDKRDAEAATISTSDESRLKLRDQILEKGMGPDFGTDSPYYKEFSHYADRVLAKDTLGGIDKLKTEINGKMQQAIRAADYNTNSALKTIKESLSNFQENEIMRSARTLETSGVNGASRNAEQLIAERAATNAKYRDYASTLDDLTNHLGIGDFKGTGTLETKIAKKLSPEQLMSKFSPKGNADFIPFLEKNFPGTAQFVKRSEAQRYLRKAVTENDGKLGLDFKKLGRTVKSAMTSEPEVARYALGDEAISKIRAANTLTDAIPNPRNSGTPKGISQLISGMPTGAMATVGWLTGHSPLVSGAIGAIGEKAGPYIADVHRLGLLRLMAADQPVNGTAYKAMADFMHNTYKGETLISKATASVLKRGSQVLTTSMMPVQADRTKLEKQLTKLQQNPSSFEDQQGSSQLGQYLPSHQASVSKVSTQIQQYLQQIKPQDHTFGPLDKPEPPTPVETARYNRALDIAIQPAIVLQHVKDGTLMPSDIQDLHNMYPSLYQMMSQKLTSSISNSQSNEELIPYHTKVGISLFLGQPMDNTMTPQGIMAAQPVPKPQQPQGQGGTKSKSGATSKLGKTDKSYQTATQAAEADRNDRT